MPVYLEPLIKPIKDAANWVDRETQALLDRLRQAVDNPGHEAKLREVGERWVTAVGNALGDIADTIAMDKLATNWEWRGRSADAYKAIVPAQAKGLNDIKDLANQIKSSLGNLANAIENFKDAIKIIIAGFVAAVVVAIVSCFVPVTIPAALAILAGEAAAGLAAVLATYQARQTLDQTIVTEFKSIEQKVHDNLGEWHKVNGALLGRASVNDPAGMGWHVNN
ncbi:hypothetical protein D5S17_11715 [Pseudonocardiaceae bacterium YIM PH 21723]|nr:hypothetical protein D5S17_11715 [Pseudonocardiaceae bacterium YIM PH 21723]